MVKIFKWWWAWNYEQIEEWLESMEADGFQLVETRFDGVYFCFEKCTPAKARYCIDYQTRLTPEYITILNDDGWKLYKIGFGWYVLRKAYLQERPDFYNDFDGLIARNKSLLKILAVLLIIELLGISNMISNYISSGNKELRAYVCIFTAFVLAFFSFVITNLVLQIHKFTNKT